MSFRSRRSLTRAVWARSGGFRTRTACARRRRGLKVTAWVRRPGTGFRLCLLAVDVDYAQCHLAHYTRRPAEGGKYDLTVWPYHAMLGGIGHALAPAVDEAFFFHGVARHSQPEFQVKGEYPLTEHHSMLGPEVTDGPDGDRVGRRNTELIDKLLTFDAVIVAGQEKSHCLAWTIDDPLKNDEVPQRPAPGTYLLEDCTSPVVVPGVDYTDEADAAFERYAAAGLHVTRSTDPIGTWPRLGGDHA